MQGMQCRRVPHPEDALQVGRGILVALHPVEIHLPGGEGPVIDLQPTMDAASEWLQASQNARY